VACGVWAWWELGLSLGDTWYYGAQASDVSYANTLIIRTVSPAAAGYN
jgi:hypothetical protein